MADQVDDKAEGVIPLPERIDIKYLVRALIKYGASDLHVKAGRPPLFRINGKLVPATMPQLTSERTRAIISSILNEKQIRDLEAEKQLDLSFRVRDLGRFRCSVFYQRGSMAATIRMIPNVAPNLADLGLPGIVKELCYRPRGLILITGATGSGKSTTLAAMIQHMNENRHSHILTVEDPIEFLFSDEKASITQREVGADVNTFEEALYSGLRQDPDIIMIGELRSTDAIQTALTAAETGHLVLATLHTSDAKSSVERIIDVFPAEAKNQIRIQLASSLVAVVSQRLLARADGTGQVLASEVMIKSPTIEKYLMKGDLDQIPEAIRNSKSYYKMQTFNQDLERLIGAGTITLEEALKASNYPEDLKLRMSGVSREEGYGAGGR